MQRLHGPNDRRKIADDGCYRQRDGLTAFVLHCDTDRVDAVVRIDMTPADRTCTVQEYNCAWRACTVAPVDQRRV